MEGPSLQCSPQHDKMGLAAASKKHAEAAAPLPMANRCSVQPTRPHRQSRQWNSPSRGRCPPPPKPSGHTAGSRAAAASGSSAPLAACAPGAASAGDSPSLPAPAVDCSSAGVSRAMPPILDINGHWREGEAGAPPSGTRGTFPSGTAAAAVAAAEAPVGTADCTSAALARGHRCLNGQPEPDMVTSALLVCRDLAGYRASKRATVYDQDGYSNSVGPTRTARLSCSMLS